jgi:exosortase
MTAMSMERLSLRAQGLSPRDLLAAAGLAAATVVTLGDAWRDIARLAFANEELGYLLLAPVMIIWLAWVRRHKARESRVRGNWLGIGVMLAGWAVYWYGYSHDPVLWRAGAVLTGIGAVMATLGRDVFVRFLPAFAACVFLIPISPNGRYRLAVPLQDATAGVTQSICDVLGIYVDRAGSLLTINGVDVAVVEACNGMRMILTLFLVCYVVAFTLPIRPSLRVLFLAASPLVAIAANVVRLVPTVWLFGNASADVAHQFHDISGWVMTVLAFLLLLGFFSLLQGATGVVMKAVLPATPSPRA